jgi:putative membrane protein
MLLRWIFAAFHLLALGIGLGAIWVRSRALAGEPDAARLRQAFAADTFWAVAAVLWIGTGLVRAFGGLEKGTDYYLGNTAFLIKMALLVLILLLEIWPMVTLIRWRIALSRGQPVDIRPARRFALISLLQAGLVVAMVFAATAMARGLGA